MKYFLFILLLSVVVFSCTPDTESKTEASYTDTSFTVLDTLILLNPKLPEITNYANFDSATMTVFKTVADGTKGKLYMAADANEVVKTVVEIIQNHGGDDVDLCFLIDKTGSMWDDIERLKASMDVLFAAIKKYKNIKVALVYYGDKNVDGSSWIEKKDFSSDFDGLEKSFKKVVYSGGGDVPESLSDAAYKAVEELSWTSNKKRIMLLLGDAPSLVPPLAERTMDELVKQANAKDILCNYYPVVIGLYGIKMPPKNENLIASIYPNPASSIANIVFEKEEEYLVEIFDTGGNKIKEEKTRERKFQLDVSGFKDGLYIVRVSNPKGSEVDTQKLIVKN